ncbi:ABC transporter permease [Tolumonas lignilytica]|uniref:ABC transporter permease n=1 Tax=Tolumonas lignilytica TaxID=1283284 RepID=UPI001267D826|nr:ABC transporter permease [Tolumonas lignilytica]
MAKTLRLSLRSVRSGGQPQTPVAMSYVAILLVMLVFMLLLPGLFWAMRPIWNAAVWRALWLDPQLPLAFQTTLVSALLGSLLALSLALIIALQCYPGRSWWQVQRQLPLFLAIPHAAFAIGIVFLFAPSGWIVRVMALLTGWLSPPAWITIHDDYGFTLALALAVKESGFMLWVLFAVLGEQAISRQMTLARTMGYRPFQIWWFILLPQLMPRLAWSLVAVVAYGLSVVDMALILGPTNPPTVAVLISQWLTDPSPMLQAQGEATSLLLLFLLGVLVIFGRSLWRCRGIFLAYPAGFRHRVHHWSMPKLHPFIFLLCYGVMLSLTLWSVAGAWFFPQLWPSTFTGMNWLQADFTPAFTALWLGILSCLFCLPIALCWLEWGPQHYNALLYLPLIIPTLPLIAAQYSVLLQLRLDGTVSGVVWSHLVWVLPYMILTLSGPYRACDPRVLVTARALGFSRFTACLTVKWPMLLRPIMAAVAIGFSVSIAQYLPTLFAGGGRFDTVTTEAVALSAGGERQVQAVQALLQIMLPLVVFMLAARLPLWLTRNRKGLR